MRPGEGRQARSDSNALGNAPARAPRSQHVGIRGRLRKEIEECAVRHARVAEHCVKIRRGEDGYVGHRHDARSVLQRRLTSGAPTQPETRKAQRLDTLHPRDSDERYHAVPRSNPGAMPCTMQVVGSAGTPWWRVVTKCLVAPSLSTGLPHAREASTGLKWGWNEDSGEDVPRARLPRT